MSSSISSTDFSVLLEVGRIVRPQGIRGQVVVELVTNLQERVAAGARLHTTGGLLEVTQSSPVPGSEGLHSGRWIVAFEGVHGREAAEALRGTVLRAEPVTDPSTLWIHDLIGADVVDQAGDVHGRVVSVQANPASDLLVLDGGALVPLRFVVSHEPGGPGRTGLVTIDAPLGLFDL